MGNASSDELSRAASPEDDREKEVMSLQRQPEEEKDKDAMVARMASRSRAGRRTVKWKQAFAGCQAAAHL